MDILKKRLAERNIGLELTDKAKELLGIRGYDPVYGARPLKRVVQKYVQDPIALKILSGEIKPHERIKVDRGRNGDLSVVKEK